MSRAARLQRYLEQERAGFDWGVANCCHFVAGWFLSETGHDPMLGLPSTPTPEAARNLVKVLGGSLAEAWTGQTGIEPVAATLAHVGDVVYVRVLDFEAVGICKGRTACLVTERGTLLEIGMHKAVCAWRLP